MIRRRIWDPDAREMVDIGDTVPTGPAYYVQGDIVSYKSPIDGAVITDRAQHRAHMKRHDVVETAGIDPAYLAGKRREREQRLVGAHPDQRRERIQALRDSFEHARNQARSRGR